MKKRKDEVARRYAKAVFSNFLPQTSYEVFVKESEKLCKIIEEEKSLRNFFLSPTISSSAKIELLKQLEMTETSFKIISFLIAQNRFAIIGLILKHLKTIYLEYSRQAEATVITSQPLGEQELKLMKEILNSYYKEEKSFIIFNKITPDIVGGVIIKIGNKIIDASITTKLKNLYNSFRSENLTL